MLMKHNVLICTFLLRKYINYFLSNFQEELPIIKYFNKSLVIKHIFLYNKFVVKYVNFISQDNKLLLIWLILLVKN